MCQDIYYLSSLESALFEPTRECHFIKILSFDTGKECALVKLNPPVVGQSFVAGDIEYVVLANRHEGNSLFPIREFPCFVFITRPLITNILDVQSIKKSDLEILAWGELYRTASDADNHVFD